MKSVSNLLSISKIKANSSVSSLSKKNAKIKSAKFQSVKLPKSNQIRVKGGIAVIDAVGF